jgi:hypothetical protein
VTVASNGRILQLVVPKKSSWQISDEAYTLLEDIKNWLGVKTQTTAVEAAIRHLHRTLERDEPVHYGRSKKPPPDQPRKSA